jgi:hypothetical protein
MSDLEKHELDSLQSSEMQESEQFHSVNEVENTNEIKKTNSLGDFQEEEQNMSNPLMDSQV